MQLFKRVLLSLFPDDIVNQSVNPASMFISFISTKEFFSVINRKIVENYKLNLFDVTIDPFEFKIGFSENIPIKPKDVDLYYSYSATANLNGYRFFSPANIANSLSLVSALYVKDLFGKYDPEYFLNFLYAVYLLNFVFLARIKIFPHQQRDKNYNWLVDTFFSFYAFVFQQTGKSANKKHLEEIKKAILNKTEIFFLLLSVYQRCNAVFLHQHASDSDLYSRLFYDELKSENKQDFSAFIASHKESTKSTTFSRLEHKVLQQILPADILLRYLFLDADMSLVTEAIVAKLFDKKILDEFLAGFRHTDDGLESFLLYITDYRHFKKKFFAGVQKYVITLFRDADQEDLTEELDDLMSSIGEDVENIDSFKIPERIKKESKLMEKILNFYITLIGGFRVSRGDNYFLRLFRKPLIQKLAPGLEPPTEKNYTLMYYGALLHQYGKNVFYYKYTADNVRAGKQKFILPLKPNSKSIYSNISLLKSFDEHFLAVILQDINPKDIRIYLKHKKILELFRDLLGKQISLLVKSKRPTFLQSIYGGLAQHIDGNSSFLSSIKKGLSEMDLFHIKENVYNMDFWVSQIFYQYLHGAKIVLRTNYSDMAILGMFAQIRETLFGFLLYRCFLQRSSTSTTNLHLDILLYMYVKEVLHIDDEYVAKISKVIEHIADTFQEILTHWLSLDDNKDFLTIGMDNWIAFTAGKSPAEIIKKASGEDILWFTGFLKNITYYNKRFLIPK